MLGFCSNEWADDIGGRNNAGEDRLERKMVASGQVWPVGSTHIQRMKKIYCMLNCKKCKKLVVVATGDLQFELVTRGIDGSSTRLKCLSAALEGCSSRLNYGIRDIM